MNSIYRIVSNVIANAISYCRYSHWTSSRMLAFIGIISVMWRATQTMVALWCPLKTFRWAPLRLPDVEGNTVRLSGGCSGPSKVAWDKVMPHAKMGGGFPPSAAHSRVSSEPSFTGTNWFPGSSRRPSISRYVPRGASVTRNHAVTASISDLVILKNLVGRERLSRCAKEMIQWWKSLKPNTFNTLTAGHWWPVLSKFKNKLFI